MNKPEKTSDSHKEDHKGKSSRAIGTEKGRFLFGTRSSVLEIKQSFVEKVIGKFSDNEQMLEVAKEAVKGKYPIYDPAALPRVTVAVKPTILIELESRGLKALKEDLHERGTRGGAIPEGALTKLEADISEAAQFYAEAKSKEEEERSIRAELIKDQQAKKKNLDHCKSVLAVLLMSMFNQDLREILRLGDGSQPSFEATNLNDLGYLMSDPVIIFSKLYQVLNRNFGSDAELTGIHLDAQREIWQERFINIKQFEKESTSKYLKRFEDLISEGKQLTGSDEVFNGQYTTRYITKKLIKGLADKRLFNLLSDRETTSGEATVWPISMSDAKRKVLEYIVKETDDKKRDYRMKDKAVFITSCYNCGRKGHLSKECRSSNPLPSCEHCGKFNHTSEQCYKKKYSEKKSEKDKVKEKKKVSYAEAAKEDETAWVIADLPDHYALNAHIIPRSEVELLDSGATVSIYGNPQLFESTPIEVEEIRVQGIAEGVRVNHKGKVKDLGIEAYYLPGFGVNLVCMHDLDLQCEEGCMSRIRGSKGYGFSGTINGSAITFYLVGKLYIRSGKYNTDKFEEVANNQVVQAPVSKQQALSKKQLKRCKRVAAIMDTMGVSPTTLKEIIRSNGIQGLGIDSDDVDLTIDRFGCGIPYAISRMRRRHNVKVSVKDPRPRPLTYVQLFADLFEHKGITYILSVSSKKLLQVKVLVAKSAEEVSDAIDIMIINLKVYQHIVVSIHSDGESAINSLLLADHYSVPVEKLTGAHIGEIEVMVRVIKERAVMREQVLPYNIPRVLHHYLFYQMAIMINITSRMIDGELTSPREILTGNKVSYEQFEIGYGELVAVNDPDEGPRAGRVALVLYPTLLPDKSYQVYDLVTHRIRQCNTYTRVQMTAQIAEQVERLGEIDDLPMDERDADSASINLIKKVYQERIMATIEMDDKMSYKTCKQRYPSDTDRAIDVELKGLLHVFEPTKERSELRSFMFFKAKKDSEGRLIKIKCRLVANGSMQPEWESVPSTTPSWSHTMAWLALHAKQGKKFKLCDVPQAYLHATNDNNHIMVLEKFVVDRLVELRSEWKAYVRANGTMNVKLIKSLYGLKESGFLWQRELQETLNHMGYTSNPYDPCFLRNEKVSIAAYVDDLIISADKEEDIDSIVQYLSDKYGALTVSETNCFTYLGMDIRIRHQQVEVRSTYYIKETLERCYKSDKEYITPCDKRLYEVDNSEQLKGVAKDQFHSIVAKLLYVALRARPDILLTVVYLCSRVSIATSEDEQKLNRLLGYLKKRAESVLVIAASEDVEAYVDAAYGVHEIDRKSQSGIFISLGRGPIYLKCSKQKLVAKSSTEAEINALSSVTSVLIGLLNFIKAEGFAIRNVTVYEDNMSVIAMLRNQRPISDATRHINIHKFFVSDHLASNGIDLRHCPSEKMKANGFTKPLMGSEFLDCLKMFSISFKDQNGTVVHGTVILNRKNEITWYSWRENGVTFVTMFASYFSGVCLNSKSEFQALEKHSVNNVTYQGQRIGIKISEVVPPVGFVINSTDFSVNSGNSNIYSECDSDSDSDSDKKEIKTNKKELKAPQGTRVITKL